MWNVLPAFFRKKRNNKEFLVLEKEIIELHIGFTIQFS
jgi:hypothetical protein